MNSDRLVSLVVNLPAIMVLGRSINPDGTIKELLTNQEKKEAIETNINLCVERLLTFYEWPFAVSSFTMQTTANVATYEAEGDNQDCRSIINIRYGDTELLLTKYRQVDIDLELSNAENDLEVSAWIDETVTGGFPRFRLIGTPTSVEDLKIRYWLTNTTISQVPDNFENVMKWMLAAELDPSLRGIADEEIKRMIAMVQPPGGSPQVIQQSARTRANNNKYASLQGYR